MRYLILATDYDGTLAKHGHVEEPVWTALRRLRESGRKAVMVTGRELEDLQAICPHLELFDRVVAENGALIYRPATKETRLLSDPPPPEFARALKAHGVVPLSVGHVILATVKPYETAVLKTINEMGLELQVIFNQDAVMVLPSGVNKATGLIAALKEMGYSPHNAVGIGDAENDHALLAVCECGAAVGNGVPALRERADLITRGAEGTSVVDLVDRILADDLESIADRMTRHDILLGTTRDGKRECIAPYGKNVLVVGTSGSGKSTLAAGLLERLDEAKYQYAIIDPEGDYAKLSGAVVLGSAERAPLAGEVLNVLDTGRNAVVNLLGVSVGDRRGFFQQLFPTLLEHRSRHGRPHWVVIDEAHQLMPKDWSLTSKGLPHRLHGLLLITVHPGSVSRHVLARAEVVLAMGTDVGKTLTEFCAARGDGARCAPPADLRPGEAAVYWPSRGIPPVPLAWAAPKAERRRHSRKYAEGRLPEERSFVFRGPHGTMHLRAYNLMTFLELAEGVDDATWLHHLKGRDYSKWFRDAIKDDELARDVAEVESKFAKDPAGSRAAVRKAVEQRYTLPMEPAAGTT
jgi:hydroxymethylpyrimidine pyrophosphatase-like HAD family hydrolase/energy-coupling factor transporter ATP-binding protein EcfA2